MFEPAPTWPYVDFGQIFMWIVANSDQIMRYDFVEARQVIHFTMSTRKRTEMFTLNKGLDVA